MIAEHGTWFSRKFGSRAHCMNVFCCRCWMQPYGKDYVGQTWKLCENAIKSAVYPGSGSGGVKIWNVICSVCYTVKTRNDSHFGWWHCALPLLFLFLPFSRSELKSQPEKIPSEIWNQIIRYLFVFPMYFPAPFRIYDWTCILDWFEVKTCDKNKSHVSKRLPCHASISSPWSTQKIAKVRKLCSGIDSSSEFAAISFSSDIPRKQHKFNIIVHGISSNKSNYNFYNVVIKPVLIQSND